MVSVLIESTKLPPMKSPVLTLTVPLKSSESMVLVKTPAMVTVKNSKDDTV